MARMQLEVEKQIKKRKRASSPPSIAITVNENSALAFISRLRSGLPGFFDRLSSTLLGFARLCLILFEFSRFCFVCSELFSSVLLRSTFSLLDPMQILPAACLCVSFFCIAAPHPLTAAVLHSSPMTPAVTSRTYQPIAEQLT